MDYRTVLITGAGGGIGAELAGRFSADGDNVVIVDIDGDAAARTAAELPGARAFTADVTKPDQIAGVVEASGPVDVLVNNAMACSILDFSDLDLADWHRDIEVNLTGAFVCIRAVLPGMVAKRSGAIVNVSSVNALAHFGNEAYSAAKAGLLALTRSIAVRYGRDGVRCNAVVPGTIRTHVWDRALATDPGLLDRVATGYPLGRVGEAADVAAAVRFLCSAEAGWITGVSLPVDGGLMAKGGSVADELTGSHSLTSHTNRGRPHSTRTD